jgi:hypothetical protein
MRKLLGLLAIAALIVAAGRAYYLHRTRQPHYIELNWTNPTLNERNRPEAVEIFRGVAPGKEDPAPLAIVPIPSPGNLAPGPGTYKDFAILPGTTYYYYVVETNRVGRSGKSPETRATSLTDPPWYEPHDVLLIAALALSVLALVATPFAPTQRLRARSR